MNDLYTFENVAEQNVDVIGNIEALLREDYNDDGSTHEDFGCKAATHVGNTNHFFVVSTPTTPTNPRPGCFSGLSADAPIAAAPPHQSTLTSTMNSSAAPYQPRNQSSVLLVGSGGTAVPTASEGLFSVGMTPTFTPYAPAHFTLATPPRTSSLRDALRPGFITFDALKSYTNTHYAVIVNNLDPRTQSKHLMSIFFPLGAVDALSFQSPVGSEAMGVQFAGRKGGIVLFASSEMAGMAASKIDDFVPHGQTLPLHTTYFGRFEDYLAVKDTFTMERQLVAAPSFSACHHNSTSSNFTCGLSSPNCCSGGEQQTQQPPAAADRPADTLVALFTTAASISTAECDKALDALLSRFAKDPSPRNTDLIVTVATALHSQSESEDGAAALPHAPHFLRSLSRYVIQTGLMNPSSDRLLKVACGSICGVMFAAQIVKGNPFAMALRIVKELVLAGTVLSGEDSVDPLPFEVGQANTLDALVKMGDVWKARSATLKTVTDESEAEFNSICQLLVAQGRYVATGSGSSASTPPPAPLPATASANSTINNMSVMSEGDERAAPCVDGSAPMAAAADISAIACVDAINTSTATEAAHAKSVGSFHVSSAVPSPVRVGPPTANDVSVESTGSSVGPTTNANVSAVATLAAADHKFSPSSLQTPEKAARVLPLDTINTPSGPITHHRRNNSGSNYAQFHNGLASVTTLTMAAAPLPPGLLGSGSGPTTTHSNHPPYGLLAGPEGSNLRQHLMASTVYMTKVPLTLAHSTLRRLFDCFGEYNKVRIYEERKGNSNRSAANTATPFSNRGNFGFVEFVVPASSKSMVDFFRNPNVAVQQRMGIPKADMDAILSMRVSYARSCIHDTDPNDAFFDHSDVSPMDIDTPGRKIKPCTFGYL